ncbi:MAG: gluconate transporter, partial [Bacteroidota bacterium]
KFISERIHLAAPDINSEAPVPDHLPSVGLILSIISVPIVLILCNTVLDAFIEVPAGMEPGLLQQWMSLIGHPFVALILANLLAWYFLGLRKGLNQKQLLEITTQSMGPAGIIILLTGAGGVFKQMLVDTGAGEMMASYFAEAGWGILFFAFVAAVLIRILQGSATVAMITAAGLVAPLMSASISPWDAALLVIAIASGASILSHVNDSGFWLVSKYLGMDEKQTFRSWSMMTTILAVTGFIGVVVLSLLT